MDSTFASMKTTTDFTDITDFSGYRRKYEISQIPCGFIIAALAAVIQ